VLLAAALHAEHNHPVSTVYSLRVIHRERPHGGGDGMAQCLTVRTKADKGGVSASVAVRNVYMAVYGI